MKIGFCGSLLTNKIILFMTRTHCVNPHLTFLLFLSKFTVYLLRIYFPSRNLCSILFQICWISARSAPFISHSSHGFHRFPEKIYSASTPHLLSESKVILLDFFIDLLDFCAKRIPSRSPLQRYIILANCASVFEKSGGARRGTFFSGLPLAPRLCLMPHALALADL